MKVNLFVYLFQEEMIEFDSYPFPEMEKIPFLH